jgi:hypothetical protein
MITFSFRPADGRLPSIDASVSTFVVSWKEAAEGTTRRERRLRDPGMSGSNVAWSPFSFFTLAFALEHDLSTSWPGRSSVVPEFSTRPSWHLRTISSMLVVDVDALRLVDLLHLADEVQLGRIEPCPRPVELKSLTFIEPSGATPPARRPSFWIRVYSDGWRPG